MLASARGLVESKNCGARGDRLNRDTMRAEGRRAIRSFDFDNLRLRSCQVGSAFKVVLLDLWSRSCSGHHHHTCFAGTSQVGHFSRSQFLPIG